MREPKDKKGRQGRGRSMDGIVGKSPQLGQLAGRQNRSVRRPGLSAPSFHPNRAQPVSTLGSDLRRAEGFHPMRPGSGSLGLPAGRQGVAAAAAETDLVLDEPIILNDEVLSGGEKKTKARRAPRGRFGFKRIALTLLVLLLAGGAYMGIRFYVLERHLFRGGGGAPALASSVDINQLKGEGDGRINILILGNGGPEHQEGPDLTDTIMIASIDPTNNQVSLLSLPRDLWVKIPGDGYHKINEAYYYGKQNSKSKSLVDQDKTGVDWVDKTLEPILGIPIHYHVVVDFAAFRQTIDAVGGVDVNVPKDLSVYDTLWDEDARRNYALNVKPGQQHFDGTRALLYARSRYTSPRGDFDRAERQRLLLTALKDKVLSVGTFSNPVRVSGLLSSLGSNVYSDFSLNDIKRLYTIISSIPSSSVNSLDLVTPPHDLLTTGNLNGTSIVRPKTGLYDYAPLQSYIRNTVRDGFLLKENASIAIYNATSIAGLATKEGDLLKSYGYNVTLIETASKITEPATTTLIDLSKGSAKYTRHYLQQRLSVVAANSVPASSGITPPPTTQFVIILGKDAATYTTQ